MSGQAGNLGVLAGKRIGMLRPQIGITKPSCFGLACPPLLLTSRRAPYCIDKALDGAHSGPPRRTGIPRVAVEAFHAKLNCRLMHALLLRVDMVDLTPSTHHNPMRQGMAIPNVDVSARHPAFASPPSLPLSLKCWAMPLIPQLVSWASVSQDVWTECPENEPSGREARNTGTDALKKRVQNVQKSNDKNAHPCSWSNRQHPACRYGLVHETNPGMPQCDVPPNEPNATRMPQVTQKRLEETRVTTRGLSTNASTPSS